MWYNLHEVNIFFIHNEETIKFRIVVCKLKVLDYTKRSIIRKLAAIVAIGFVGIPAGAGLIPTLEQFQEDNIQNLIHNYLQKNMKRWEMLKQLKQKF